MTKEEIEAIVMTEKIMSMEELKVAMIREGMMGSTDEIIKSICTDEMREIKDQTIEKKEVSNYIRNFSPATAQRQIDALRKGQKVWGPWPSGLGKNTKTYYPAIEIASVMYIQRHAATMYGRPSLSRILETRHG